MKNNKRLDKHTGKWVLLNKNNKVIYYSSNIVDVVQEGHKYPITDVSIEKKLLKGTCFF